LYQALTEIAFALERCRSNGNHRSGILHNSPPLLGPEEDAVFLERAAYVVTEIVLAVIRRDGGEMILGVEYVVAKEFKDVAMECVGAGMGNEIGPGARRTPGGSRVVCAAIMPAKKRIAATSVEQDKLHLNSLLLMICLFSSPRRKNRS
jgi:hypothetical protein